MNTYEYSSRVEQCCTDINSSIKRHMNSQREIRSNLISRLRQTVDLYEMNRLKREIENSVVFKDIRMREIEIYCSKYGVSAAMVAKIIDENFDEFEEV